MVNVTDIIGDTQPGPCCVCGKRNYPLSAGGPKICPTCDCGNFTQATVAMQAKRIQELEGKLRKISDVFNTIKLLPDRTLEESSAYYNLMSAIETLKYSGVATDTVISTLERVENQLGKISKLLEEK